MKLKAALQQISKEDISSLKAQESMRVQTTQKKCDVDSLILIKVSTKLTDLGEPYDPLFSISKDSKTNPHMVLQLENQSEHLCLDKTWLTRYYKKGQDHYYVGKYRDELTKERGLVRLLDGAKTIIGTEFTFHYTEKHKDNMFIIYKEPQEPPTPPPTIPNFYVIRIDFEPIALYISRIISYGMVTKGESSVVQRNNPNERIVKLFAMENPQCFTLPISGGNPKAKVMHRIRLTSPTPPEVFIIGKYAHPRAPYIVLPAMRSWITKNQITFPVTDGKSKLVVYRKGNQLIAPTPGNKNDVFIVSHIVNKRVQRGGGLTIVVDDPTNSNIKCVAKKITLLLDQETKTNDVKSYKSVDNAFSGTLDGDGIKINNNLIALYPRPSNKTPTSIILHENPKHPNTYIMAWATYPPAQPVPQVQTVSA